MKATGHLDSVYCLATNTAGTVVVSGSTERVSTHAIGLLRIWDPRTAEKSGRLKGHTDNIRCVVVSQDGTKCISGSSDATVKLWDIGQQRCIHSFAIHSDSVWSLAADAQFESFISAGRDQHVYSTDIKTLDSTCICRTRDPVLKVVLSPDKGMWLSMTNSDIEFWDVERALQSERAMRTTSRRPSVHSMSHSHHRKPLASPNPQEPDSNPVPILRDPSQRIEGLPAIIKHDFLDNRREVLVQDTTGNVSVVDVTSGRETKKFGRVNFDEKRQELEEQIAVPSWCSVDCKLGSLSVKLDFPQVFSCEVYAPDAGFPSGPDFDEQKLNVSALFLATELGCKSLIASAEYVQPTTNCRWAFACAARSSGIGGCCAAILPPATETEARAIMTRGAHGARRRKRRRRWSWMSGWITPCIRKHALSLAREHRGAARC
jgi:WD repeat-containing protein 48